jgi:4-amino-4-deoxy-L-arabinose transferase-like glycosyltransferase
MERATGWPELLVTLLLYIGPALVQAVLVLVLRPVPVFDGLFVVNHARALLETGRMDPMTYYPPLMTWWYAGWFRVFGASDLVAQLSQIPLSLGVTWTTVRLVRVIGGSAGAARLAGLIVAWYPSFIGYVLTTPYYHYLYTVLTVAMVAALLRGEEEARGGGGGRWMVAAGVAAGLGALTKATQLIAPLQVATWLVMVCLARGRWPTRRLLFGCLLFGAGMLVTVGPWTLRNARVFDALVPVCTSGGLVLFSANNPESNGLYSETPDIADIESPAEMLAHSRWCTEQAKAFMRDEPAAFVRLAVRKFIHTWGGESTFAELINRRGVSEARLEAGFSALFFAGWTALALVWAGESVRRWRRRVPLSTAEWLVAVLILSNAAVYLVFEGGDRHHLPLVPLIVAILLHQTTRNEKEPKV